jgi:MFS family permease
VGVSAYTDYLIKDLKLGRFWLSTAYMSGTILSSFLIGYVGKFLDSWGIRPIAALSSFLMGLVLIFMSQVDKVSFFIHNLFPTINLAIVSFVVITLGFLALRFTGQGALTLASKTLLMEWFIHLRGRMNAFSGIFKSLTFSGAPLFFTLLIKEYGWRGSWIILGAGVGIFGTLFILIFFRDKPENCGLTPDGHKIEHSNNKQMNRIEVNWSARDAKRTYSFWIFNLGLSIMALYNTALMFHLESIFEISGLNSELAFSTLLPAAAVVSLVLHFVCGWLSDFIVLKYFLCLLVGGIIISSLGVFMLKTSGIGLYLMIIGNGLSGGMFSTLNSVTWPRFFGRAHLGAIGGYSMSYLVFFSAIGPFLFGLSHKISGNYSGAIFGCSLLAIILLLAGFKADAPIKEL